MSDELETQVIEIIAKKRKLDPASVTVDSAFTELGIDSLDAADLLFTFEEKFDINVPDEAAQSIRTVRDVVEGIRKLRAQRATT